MALVLVGWLRPSVAPLEGFAAVFFVQVVAFAASRWLAPARGTRVVKALVSAALLSLVVIVLLRPAVSVSFDDLFLLVAAFELVALGVGVYLAGTAQTRGE